MTLVKSPAEAEYRERLYDVDPVILAIYTAATRYRTSLRREESVVAEMERDLAASLTAIEQVLRQLKPLEDALIEKGFEIDNDGRLARIAP